MAVSTRGLKPIILFNHFLAVLVVLLFFSESASYLYHIKVMPISMTNWAFVLLANALLLLVLSENLLKTCFSRPIFKWLLAFLIVNCIWAWYPAAVAGNFQQQTIDQFNRCLLLVIYMFSFGIIFSRESAFVIARQTAFLVTIITVGINIFDFISLNPAQFSHIIGRAAGCFKDPNNCAIVLTFAFILTIGIVRPSLKFIYTLWVFLGIILTQSRGGILVFSLLFLLYLYNQTYSKKSILLVGSVFTALLVVVGFTLFDSIKADLFKAMNSFENIFLRYNQLLTMHTESFGTDTRAQILSYYMNLWAQKPILGHGLGAANYYLFDEGNHSVSSHNQFLFFMVELGLIGFPLLMVFLKSLVTYKQVFLCYKEALAFILVFLLFSFTSHVLFNLYSLFFLYIMFTRFLQYKYENQHPMFRIKYLKCKGRKVQNQTIPQFIN